MRTVEVHNMTKIYRAGFQKNRVTALKNFSLSVEGGNIFGLLGPNGAGKTTLIKILLGITFPTDGEAKILGQSIYDFQVRKQIGYLPENHRFPSYLTGEQLLRLVAELTGYDRKNINIRIDELLELVKMYRWKKTKIKKYSKGMMQRIGLAQALINDPDLIFLDEPTDGVDPIGRKEIRDMLSELKSQGKTIFVNSHLLSEVELISDRVAILNKGELITEGTVEDITTNKELYRISFENSIPENILSSSLKDYTLNAVENHSSYTLKVNNIASLNQFIDDARKAELNIRSIVPQKSSLEDMFISLIKESDEKNNK
jgi:ABC-2 type transport system ATP-binding protein